MKNIFLTLLMGLVLHASAQSNANIASALGTFNEAADQNGMLQAVKEMKAVSDQDQDDWLAAYWTSFFYSQTGRNSGQPKAYYDSAQLYFDRAKASHPEQTPVESSEFHVLQSLIYDLTAGTYWTTGDTNNGTRLNNLANSELNLAIKNNPRNPRVYLLTGTDLISNGLRLNNNGWTMAGKEILEKARTLYESEKPGSDIAPNWGNGWINFWISRAKID